MNTKAQREQHRTIMALVSRLRGIAGDYMTRGDADDARTVIRSIDDVLRLHLAEEDVNLYPALLAADDEETRWLGADAFEAMGEVVGAWAIYYDRWTVEAMLGEANRFVTATVAVLDALSLRIETENDVLYPAVERLTGAARRSAA